MYGYAAERATRAALSLMLSTAAPAWADWSVGQAPGGAEAGCVLESGDSPVFDGYQTTSARIMAGPTFVAIKVKSTLDPGFSDIGVRVDNKEFISADKINGEKTVLFDSSYEKVVEQFKAGIRVKVQLRFWPTWPVTGTHTADFSLIGFTKGFEEMMSRCR
jgi:hypothetical protein